MPTFIGGDAGRVVSTGRICGTNVMVGAWSLRERVAAAMSEAIRRGDVRGVLAALSLLDVQPPSPISTESQSQFADSLNVSV